MHRWRMYIFWLFLLPSFSPYGAKIMLDITVPGILLFAYHSMLHYALCSLLYALRLVCKLPAGCINILASAATYCNHDTLVTNSSGKFIHLTFIRFFERDAGN